MEQGGAALASSVRTSGANWNPDTCRFVLCGTQVLPWRALPGIRPAVHRCPVKTGFEIGPQSNGPRSNSILPTQRGINPTDQGGLVPEESGGFVMCEIFDCSLKHFVAAVFLSCTVASVVCAATAPNAAGSGPSINVNRAGKGDRLPVNPTLPVKPAGINSNETLPSPAYVPPGCEPMFSPVAEPVRARVAGRCLT